MTWITGALPQTSIIQPAVQVQLSDGGAAFRFYV